MIFCKTFTSDSFKTEAQSSSREGDRKSKVSFKFRVFNSFFFFFSYLLCQHIEVDKTKLGIKENKCQRYGVLLAYS